MLPADGAEFTVSRRFRGATYRIAVRKPQGFDRARRRLIVDGRAVAGNIVPLPAGPGGVVEVEALYWSE